MPPLDSTEVPVNVRELVFASYYGPFELRRSDTNDVVPIGTPQLAWGPSGPVQRVSVNAVLAPSTAYALLESGVERLRFRTGTTADDVAPGPVGIEEFSIKSFEPDDDGGSCRPNTWDTTSRLVVPSDATTIGVRFTGEGRVQEFVLSANERALEAFGTGTCMVHVALDEGRQYDVEVWARDLAGNEGPVAKTPVEVTGCGCRSTSPHSGLALLLIAYLRRRRRSGANHDRCPGSAH